MTYENKSAEQSGTVNELRIIREMLEKTRRNVADAGIFFIVWGWLTLVGCIATYTMIQMKAMDYIWIAWAFPMGIGWIMSFILGIRQSRKSRVVSHMDQAITYLWIACGVTMGLVGFLSGFSDHVTYRPIFTMIAMIGGVGIFASGGILEWNSLKFGGLLWWVGAIVMMFTPLRFHSLILAGLIVPGFLVPGYSLRKRYTSLTTDEQVQAA